MLEQQTDRTTWLSDQCAARYEFTWNRWSRQYTGHAFDQVQGRGFTPTVVENAIQNGSRSAGNQRGTFQHVVDGLKVITNANGEVIAVIPREDMMQTVEVRGELGQRVSITVHGYERSEPQGNVYDANWLRCAIEVTVGSFNAAVEAALTTADFGRFASQVAQLRPGVEGDALFDTMEESLTFKIAIDRVGRAVVSGELRDTTASGHTALSFAFNSDASFLRQLKAQVARLASAFPDRQA